MKKTFITLVLGAFTSCHSAETKTTPTTDSIASVDSVPVKTVDSLNSKIDTVKSVDTTKK